MGVGLVGIGLRGVGAAGTGRAAADAADPIQRDAADGADRETRTGEGDQRRGDRPLHDQDRRPGAALLRPGADLSDALRLADLRALDRLPEAAVLLEAMEQLDSAAE